MNRLAALSQTCPITMDGVGVASMSLAIEATRPMPEGCNVQLLPDGEFAANDGRPGTIEKSSTKVWRLDVDTAVVLIAHAGSGTPLVVDYEHQTLAAKKNGQPAPAAGWITACRYEPGRGLFASVKWTDKAAAHIKAGEYRYLSPVFTFDLKTGHVLRLYHAALTNTPALSQLEAVVASSIFTPDMEEHMPEWLQKLRAALGLPDDADEAAVCKAVYALVAASKEFATAQASARSEEAANITAMAALQNELVALRAELAATQAAKAQEQLDGIIATALSDGRLPKAMEEWARDLGKSNPEALAAYLEKAQPIAALAGMQTQAPDKAAPGAEGAAALTAEEQYAADQLGMSYADYAKTKKEQ